MCRRLLIYRTGALSTIGVIPLLQKKKQKLFARDLKPIIQPKGVIFAEDPEGNPIGFAITLPDINRLLKGLNGHLFPFGWLKLLLEYPNYIITVFLLLESFRSIMGKGLIAFCIVLCVIRYIHLKPGWKLTMFLKIMPQ